MNTAEVPKPDATSWRLDTAAEPMANAFVLARIARLAYLDSFDCPTEGPLDALPEAAVFCAAFPIMSPVQTLRVRGFVAANEDHAVVAFAGTHRPDHWRESLRYDQVLDFGGRAHQGLTEVLENVAPQVLAGLYDANALTKTLWLTGHSLGGGLATLAAWRLHHMGYEPRAVCSFGAPPVLDAAAAQAYPVEAWCFANDGDWVPRMQWPRIGTPYAHPGRVFNVLRSGRLAPAHHSPEMARRMDRFERLEGPREYGGPFVDHTMKEYIRRIVANRLLKS